MLHISTCSRNNEVNNQNRMLPQTERRLLQNVKQICEHKTIWGMSQNRHNDLRVLI